MNKPTIDTADRLERLARDAVNLTGYVRIVMNDAVKRLRELERENAELKMKLSDAMGFTRPTNEAEEDL